MASIFLESTKNTIHSNNVAKKCYLVKLELILGKLCIQLTIFQGLQNYLEMENMLFYNPWVHQDFFNEDNYKLIKVKVKHPVHEVTNAAGAFINPKGITKNS